jgi:bla regulator protein BlaR1
MILTALGNHLWQWTLFAAMAGVLALILQKYHARVRYWVWLAASIKFLIPFSLLVAIGSRLAWSPGSPVANKRLHFAIEVISGVTPVVPGLIHLLPALVALWLCGFLAVFFVWYVQWRKMSVATRDAAALLEGREVESLRRMERNAGIRKQIEIRLSRASVEPGIFGIVRPVLMWPEGISKRLEDAQLDAILAHEVRHVRRHDNLAAAVHMVVEAIFWFHPFVWWLGARMVEERERACAEDVWESGSERQVYAEGILKMCEFCLMSPLACMSGVAGGDLSREIVGRNALLFSLLHFEGWIFVEPIVRDAELEKADQAFMFVAGGIRAITPRCTKLNQIWSGEFSQHCEANIFRPRQQVNLKESLALVRG